MDIYSLAREGKIKRYFRARNKISAPGIISHITQRATGKTPLFLEESDYLKALIIIKRCSEKFSVDIFSFVLMPNHIHLLCRLNKDNLYVCMRSMFGQYGQYFNKKYERKGHLFGDRYRQAVCFDDLYLLISSLYITLNPVRAGLVNNFSEYRWSSWKVYCQEIKSETFVNFKPILYLLDSEDIEYARSKYKKLLVQGSDIETTTVFEDPKVLDSFKNKMKENYLKLKGGKIYGILNSKDYLNDFELEKEIEKLQNCKRFVKPKDKKAVKFLVRQLYSRGFNNTEIMEKLNISYRTLYKYKNPN